MIGWLQRARDVVLEAWRVARVPANPEIAAALGELAQRTAGDRSPEAIDRYLQERPALSRLQRVRDWFQDPESGEWRLGFSNTLFAPGLVRWAPGPPGGDLIVFLHGSLGDAACALGDRPDNENMNEIARAHGAGLVSWDWPFHGARLNEGLYRGLQSVVSNEREYSRMLPALGTSLWREWVAELAFVLQQVRRRAGPDVPIHVVGYSMGAAFAYVAPLLGTRVANASAACSCARLADLLAQGKTRRHGFFLYPNDALGSFDLDDQVDALIARGVPLLVVHGDQDPGCLASSRTALAQRSQRAPEQVEIQVLPGHSHRFSSEVKARISAFLHRVRSGQPTQA